MIRRRLALTFVLVGLMTASCTNGATETTLSTSDTTSDTTAAGGAAAAGDLTFYVVGAVASGSTFWDTVRSGAEQAGEDFGVTVVYTAPETHDTPGYIPILQAASAAGADGIAIDFLDKSIEEPTLQALDSGLPVTLFNTREIGDPEANPDTAVTDPRVLSLAFVGSDIFGGARSLGAVLATYLEPGTRFVVHNPVPGIAVLATRRDGAVTAMEEAGMEFVEELPGTLDEAENEALIGAYLDSNDDIGAIIGLGTPTGNPAARAVASRGLTIPVGTFDIDTEALRLIQEGQLTATVDQQPWFQGYGAVFNLVMFVRYNMAMADINTGKEVITPDNVARVAAAVEAGR